MSLLQLFCVHTTEKNNACFLSLSLTKLRSLALGLAAQTAAFHVHSNPTTMSDYPGHLVSKPEISLQLVVTLVINEQGVSINGEMAQSFECRCTCLLCLGGRELPQPPP